MTPDQITATLAALNRVMTADRPAVSTGGCTDPRCTSCASCGTGGRR